MTPQVYAYDPETGALLEIKFRVPTGPIIPQLDQRATKQQGTPVYIPRPYTTEEVPPAVEADTWPHYIDGQWQQVVDYRGKTVYRKSNKAEIEVRQFPPTIYIDEDSERATFSGFVSLPDDLTDQVPGEVDEWDEQTEAWVKSDAAEQAHRSEAVNAERARRIVEGCSVTIGAQEIPIQGRQQDLDNLQGLWSVAITRIGDGDTTTITKFRDGANVIHDLTPPEVVDLWSGGTAYVEAVYSASWALKDSPPIPADFDDDAHWPAPVWPQPE